METTSKALNKPLMRWLGKTRTTKRNLTEALRVSRQSPVDWTSDKPKPVTADNAVRISDYANDSELTMQIVYKFFGIFRPMDGDVYKQDLSSTDDLRELEEDERDQAKLLVKRILLKQKEKLSIDDYELLFSFTKEQAEAVFANIQYLNMLCELQNISIMDLFKIYMKEWQKEGYFAK